MKHLKRKFSQLENSRLQKKIKTNSADDLVKKAFSLHVEGKLIDAAKIYFDALKDNPHHFDALHLLGCVAADNHDYKEAFTYFLKAIEVNPAEAVVYSNFGMALHQSGKPEEAVNFFKKALELNPNLADAIYNLAGSYQEIGQTILAVEEYKKYLTGNPKSFQGFNNLGNAYQKLGEFQEAINCYNKAIELKNTFPEPFNNRGNLYYLLQHYPLALQDLDKAIEIKADYAEAYNNRGNVHEKMGKFNDALADFQRAIDLKDSYAEPYHNRANLFVNVGQHELALPNYRRALDLKPTYEYVEGTAFYTQLHICNWSNFEPQLAQFLTRAALGQKVAPPFHAIALLDSGILQKQIAQTWIADKHPSSLSSFLPPLQSPVRGPKIRLAYFSADFHNHATMFLMAKLFECHDRSQFELFAFSFGPDSSDVMRQRAVAAFDHFLDVRGQSDLEIAALSRKLQIDIAVDLKGFTQHARTSIFAYRAAPIQVNYLGYPGTMGAPYIDYIVADRVLVPPGNEHFYSEKVIYMPHSYQVNDDERPIANTVYTREQLGLPDTAFVFCCFNNNYKILPTTLDSWLRILGAVSGSVLWLLADNPTAVKNLQQAVRDRGGDPSRLIFAQRMPLAEHLARHRQADLFLDTLPCNAHTTASDALWAGLPLLTWAGEAFAGRVSASLLSAMNLPELITHSQAEYEQRAIEIAHDPNQLIQLKAKVAQMRHISPLFKTQQYAHDLEAAYQEMIKSV